MPTNFFSPIFSFKIKGPKNEKVHLHFIMKHSFDVHPFEDLLPNFIHLIYVGANKKMKTKFVTKLK